MTADVFLLPGLAVGPAEAGARVVKRALDQVGAGAAVATGEMRRLESATRAAGIAHAALGKSAGAALRDSLDLGRRLSTYVKDLLRGQGAIREAVDLSRRSLADARRAAEIGIDRNRSALAGLSKELQQAAQRLATGLVIRAVIQPVVGRGAGGIAGMLLTSLIGGGARAASNVDPVRLVVTPEELKRGGGPPPLGLLKDLLGDPSRWLAETFPALFGPALPTSAAVFASPLVGAGGLLTGGGATSLATIPSATGGLLAGLAPLLPIAAIALPLVLKSLFSKKPSVGPNANATIGRLASGELGVVDSGADNGGNVRAAVDLAETSIKALTRTLRQIGAGIGDVGSIAGLQVGYFKGRYFVDDTRLGSSATYEQNQFEDAAAAVADFVRRALNRADLAGASETMRTVLRNTKARSFEDLGRDIDLARDYERDFQPLDGAKAQVEALTRRFDDLRESARELGLDVAEVDRAFARERRTLAEDFDRDVASGVLGGTIAGFRKLWDDSATRLEQARTLGADLALVERRAYYEKRAFLLQLADEERRIYLRLLGIAEKVEFAVVESLAKIGGATQKLESALAGAVAASRQAAGSYRQLGESLRDAAASIRLSDLSLLSTADKYAEVKRQYDDARTAAAAGDQDAARRLGGLARSTLELGRQFYGAGPHYAALYQEVVGALGDTAAIQDGIAVRLDLHTVLLDAQLQVLKEIDKRLAKSQEASGVLDYLDVALTRQGAIGEFDRAVVETQLRRLAELLPSRFPQGLTPIPEQDPIFRLGQAAADGTLSLEEAEDNRGLIESLRLAAYRELERQVGADSDAVRAFDRLKRAIDDSAGSTASLATRLKALGTVFSDLKDIFGGAQSPLVDPGAVQALAAGLAGLIKDLGAIVPGEAGGVLGAIGGLLKGLPATLDGVSRIDLGSVSAGLGAIGRSIADLADEPATVRLPGDLQAQKTAFRSLGDYLDKAGLAPSIAGVVGQLSALADSGGGGALSGLRSGLAGLKQPTADLVAEMAKFDQVVAALIKTLKEGPGVGGRPVVDIDRSALSGAPVAQFDALAGRVGRYVERARGAGYAESELKSSPAWSWAVAERDRIIQALATVGDVEALLDRYYGGQRAVAANADDGANNLVRRLAALQGGGGGPTTPSGLRAAVEAYVAGRAALDSYEARLLYNRWEDRTFAPRIIRWWDESRVLADIDRYAMGGVVGGPTLFGAGDRLGLMGEAGPEAILPLRRGRDGRLGVAANGNAPADPRLLADLVAEVRALRHEVADLRRQQAGEHRESIGQGALVAHRLGGRRAAAGGRG